MKTRFGEFRKFFSLLTYLKRNAEMDTLRKHIFALLTNTKDVLFPLKFYAKKLTHHLKKIGVCSEKTHLRLFLSNFLECRIILVLLDE